MRHPRTPLVLVLASLLVFTGIASVARRAATAAEPSIRLADVLEMPVIAYGEIPDGKTLFAAFDKHPWVRMMQSDPMADLVSMVRERADEAFAESEDAAEALPFIGALIDAFEGDVELAIMPGAAAPVHFMFRVGVGSSAPELLDRLTAWLRAEPYVTVVEENGVEILRAEIPDPTIGTVDCFALRGSVVIGNDRGTIDRFIAGKALESGFAASDSVRRMRSEAGQIGAHASYWLDVEEYFEMLVSVADAEESEEMARAFDWMQADGIVHGSIRYDEHGPFERGVLSGFSKSGPIARMFGTLRPGMTMQRRASASAAFWWGARVDVATLVDVILDETLVRDFTGDDEETVRERIAMLKDRDANPLGISLTEDLVPAFGDELSIEVIPPTAGPIPQVIARIAVRDAAKVREMFAKVVARLAEAGDDAPMKIREGRAGDVPMWVITPPSGPVRPAIAVTDDQLVVSLFATKMRDALAAPTTAMLDVDAFRAAVERVGGADGRAASVAVLNWRALLTYLQNAAQGLAEMLDADALPDMSLLPDVGDVREFLLPSVSAYFNVDGRFVYTATGTEGSMATFTSLLAGARLVMQGVIARAQR